MDWLRLNSAALTAEAAEGGHGRRVVRVFQPDSTGTDWIGVYGNAPVDVGPAGYRLSDGTLITL